MKSTKNVKKELGKEEKVLKKVKKKYKRAVAKNGVEDAFEELYIEVQSKLVNTLKEEQNHYEYLIMQYKSKNSDIRKNLINSVHNQ